MFGDLGPKIEHTYTMDNVIVMQSLSKWRLTGQYPLYLVTMRANYAPRPDMHYAYPGAVMRAYPVWDSLSQTHTTPAKD